MEKERSTEKSVVCEDFSSSTENVDPVDDSSCNSIDKESGLATCRVCQCTEPDRRGNVALRFLGISPPSSDIFNGKKEVSSKFKVSLTNVGNNSQNRSELMRSEFIEFISPKGEVFVCTADVEFGIDNNEDILSELGCACKSDLALAHYACALKWFINHGSIICEICGHVAKNVRSEDFKKVLVSLKEYEALRGRIVSGEPNHAHHRTNFGIDPEAVAAIRRQRLSEISLWFNPHNNIAALSLVVSEQTSTSNVVMEEVASVRTTITEWAVEGIVILLATGLLTVTLAWLIAPHVGKNTVKNGLHILLGGISALAIVVFFRIFVLTRIKYGPARYWAILFIFWFLVFGIWASRTHGARAT
ncbi:hypothetical protein Sango_2929000 [Sesamum angolense]|uniref:RING-CH-type domain-containing protein n=1 Tax=Sesamum angolense TaxID=2727404 RepID=A0AAE1T5A6_9LAMI|nr:hypothetical protein Sango_2929000 [Sesamum angolense]